MAEKKDAVGQTKSEIIDLSLDIDGIAKRDEDKINEPGLVKYNPNKKKFEITHIYPHMHVENGKLVKVNYDKNDCTSCIESIRNFKDINNKRLK